MPDLETQEIIEDTINLPTLPRISSRLLQLIRDPDAELETIGEVIETDPVLSAQVVRTANSSYFGLSEPVASANRATMVLGMQAVANLVLQTELVEQYSQLQDSGFDIEQLWRHSIRAALIARDLATRCGGGSAGGWLQPDELYTCGLLHDLGKIAMLDSMPDEYMELLKEHSGRFASSFYLEREQFGYTHTEVGAMIAYVWELPEQIVDAIECHHQSRVRLREQQYTLTVSLADELAHMVEAGYELDLNYFSVSPAFRYLGLSYEARGEVTELAAHHDITV